MARRAASLTCGTSSDAAHLSSASLTYNLGLQRGVLRLLAGWLLPPECPAAVQPGFLPGERVHSRGGAGHAGVRPGDERVTALFGEHHCGTPGGDGCTWPLGGYVGDHSHHLVWHESSTLAGPFRKTGSLQRDPDGLRWHLWTQERAQAGCHGLPPGGGSLEFLKGRQLRRRQPVRGHPRVCQDACGTQGGFPHLSGGCGPALPWLAGPAGILWQAIGAGGHL